MFAGRPPEKVELVSTMHQAFANGNEFYKEYQSRAGSTFDPELLHQAVACYHQAYQLAQHYVQENITPEALKQLSACFDALVQAAMAQYYYCRELVVAAAATKSDLLQKINNVVGLFQHHIAFAEANRTSDTFLDLTEHYHYLKIYQDHATAIQSESIKNTVNDQSAIMQLPDLDNDNYRLGKQALLRAAQTASPTQCVEAIDQLLLAYNVVQADCESESPEELFKNVWIAFNALILAYARYVENLIANMQFEKASKEQGKLVDLVSSYQQIIQPMQSISVIHDVIGPSLNELENLCQVKLDKLRHIVKYIDAPKTLIGLDATHHYLFTQVANSGYQRGRTEQCGFIAIGVPAESMREFIVGCSDAELKNVASLIGKQIFNEYHSHAPQQRQKSVRLSAATFSQLQQHFNQYDQAVTDLNQLRSELGSGGHAEEVSLLLAFEEPIKLAKQAYKDFLAQPDVIREFLLGDIAEGDIGAYTLLAWATLAKRTLVIWQQNSSGKLTPLTNMSYFSETDPDEPLHIVHVNQMHYERLICLGKTPRVLDLRPYLPNPSARLLNHLSFLQQAKAANAADCKENSAAEADKHIQRRGLY